MAIRAVLLDYFNTLTTAVRRGPRHAAIARSLGCDPATWLPRLAPPGPGAWGGPSGLAGLDRTCPARWRGAYGSAEAGLRRVAQEPGGHPSDAQVAAAVAARIVAVREDGPVGRGAGPGPSA